MILIRMMIMITGGCGICDKENNEDDDFDNLRLRDIR